MPPILTKDGNLASTSKENVKANGEVFTPEYIVNDMMAMIPSEFLADSSAVMIEPTCGTGNFLVKMYTTKRLAGLTINETLNTIIGMELNEKTVVVAQTRLYELVANDMIQMGIKQASKQWFRMAIECVMIVRNNIFKVKDSLIVMNEYAKGKGTLANKKFVFSDPTGNNEVMTDKQRTALETKVKTAFRKHKDGTKSITLAPFFGD
jgi:hypothetical protein